MLDVIIWAATCPEFENDPFVAVRVPAQVPPVVLKKAEPEKYLLFAFVATMPATTNAIAPMLIKILLFFINFSLIVKVLPTL